MSGVDQTLQSIQSTIDERKAKLEALRQKRMVRAAAAAEKTTDDGDDDKSTATTSSNGASEKDNDAIAEEFIAKMKREDDIATRSVTFSISPPDNAAASSSSSSSTSSLSTTTHPLPTSSRPSMSRAATMNSNQLHAIKASLDGIAQHATEAMQRRASHASYPTMGSISVAPATANANVNGEVLTPTTLAPPSSVAHKKSPSLDLTSVSYSNLQQSQQDASPITRHSIDATPSSAASPPTAAPSTTTTSVLPQQPLTQSREEELLAQIESLSETIRSQADDLILAGDLGSQLLSNNEDANKRIDELQSQLDSLQDIDLEYKSQLREVDRTQKKKDQEIKYLRDLQTEYESELEIVKMEKELDKSRITSLEGELYKIKNTPSDQDKLIDELRGEMSELKSINAKLESQINDSRRVIDELQESLRNLTTINQQQTQELQTATKYKAQAQQLQEQLHLLKSQSTVDVLTNLEYEKARLEDSLRELTKQYELLYDSNLKDQELLRSIEAARNGSVSSRAPLNGGKKFSSLADDEELDENGFSTSVVVSAPTMATTSTPTTPAVNDTDDERLRIATAAAAMHQTVPPGPRVHRSSLASGSASLALVPTTVTHSTGLTPPLNPIDAKHSRSGSTVMNFISNLLPGPAASSTSSSAAAASSSAAAAADARRLTFERANHHPLEGGGSGDFESLSLNDDDKESRSSHATSFLGRKVGERDADWEFFSLTLLCVKIHASRKMESLYTVSTQDLWMKAKKEKIEFHGYYQFLENQLANARVNKLYEKSAGRDPDLLPSNSAIPSAERVAGGKTTNVTPARNNNASSSAASMTAPGPGSLLSSTLSTSSHFSPNASHPLAPTHGGFDSTLVNPRVTSGKVLLVGSSPNGNNVREPKPERYTGPI